MIKQKIDEIKKIFIFTAKNPMNKIKIRCNALENYSEEMKEYSLKKLIHLNWIIDSMGIILVSNIYRWNWKLR